MHLCITLHAFHNFSSSSSSSSSYLFSLFIHSLQRSPVLPHTPGYRHGTILVFIDKNTMDVAVAIAVDIAVDIAHVILQRSSEEGGCLWEEEGGPMGHIGKIER